MTTEQKILEYFRAIFPYPHRQIIDERNPNMIILAWIPTAKGLSPATHGLGPWELSGDLTSILEFNLDMGEIRKLP